LQNLSIGGLFESLPIPALTFYEFDTDGELPTSVQWNLGAQKTLPFALALDVSYVGQHSTHRTGAGGNLTQGLNMNAVDFGTAYRADMQDPTRAPSAVPGANALSTNLLRSFQGFGAIGVRVQRYYHTAHTLQTSLRRRFTKGVSAGFSHTVTLSEKSNEDLPVRIQHGADGSISIREDQAVFEQLMENPGIRRHVMRADFVWDLPRLQADGALAVVAAIVNEWQLSGIWTGGSGDPYTPTFTYQTNGTSLNLTGSPDYAARIVVNGDPGSGCSGDRYRMFDTSVFSGPTYGSVGLESGQNYLNGCFVNIWDLAIRRRFKLGGQRSAQVRVDLFNAFNTVVYNTPQSTLQLLSPTDQQVRNSQYLPDGMVDPARLKPQSAGFGAVTSARPLRSVQIQLRLQF
jgi:hypothetical protein